MQEADRTRAIMEQYRAEHAALAKAASAGVGAGDEAAKLKRELEQIQGDFTRLVMEKQELQNKLAEGLVCAPCCVAGETCTIPCV
jgi:hypothetical protein